MNYYVCYANRDRILAARLVNEINYLGESASFVDRGDGELLIDPIPRIVNEIKGCDVFVMIHSAATNVEILPQIEITYAKNQKKKICIVKTGRTKISDSIAFEGIGDRTVDDKNMATAAKKLVKLAKEAR